MWDHEGYIAFLVASGQEVPILFQAEGFRLENIMIDVLHTCDLGITAHIVGNVLWFLAVVRNVFNRPTFAERTKRLHESIQAWYTKTKETTRMQGKLTVERLRTDGNWPKL